MKQHTTRHRVCWVIPQTCDCRILLSTWIFFSLNPNSLLSRNMSLVAKPAALLQQLETALNQPRLARFKNVIFVLVLIHYWSRLYSKVIVRGPTRAAKDAYSYCLRVCTHRQKSSYHPIYLFYLIYRFFLNNCVVSPLFKQKSTLNCPRH